MDCIELNRAGESQFAEFLAEGPPMRMIIDRVEWDNMPTVPADLRYLSIGLVYYTDKFLTGPMMLLWRHEDGRWLPMAHQSFWVGTPKYPIMPIVGDGFYQRTLRRRTRTEPAPRLCRAEDNYTIFDLGGRIYIRPARADE